MGIGPIARRNSAPDAAARGVGLDLALARDRAGTSCVVARLVHGGNHYCQSKSTKAPRKRGFLVGLE